MPNVLTERRDGVLLVTLDRPAARNAIDLATARELAAAFDELDADDGLRAAVLAANGPAFCAGMDLKAFLRGERPIVEGRGFAGLVQCPPRKPLIAAVEGPALGGGFEIVLACDLVVASTAASFGLPEVKRGLLAAGGGLLRLRDRVPLGLAVEWTLTGTPVSAATAHAVHLVNRLVEPGQAVAAALALAAEIAANAPLAVQGSKRVIREGRDWPAAEAFDRQHPIAQAVRSSADAQEGARAFAEKRPPNWTGR